MSNYNSKNTTVLLTDGQAGGNVRMMLLHRHESGRLEYIIGSYFTAKCAGFGDGTELYSLTWGHYFAELMDAVGYWQAEVIGEEEQCQQQQR